METKRKFISLMFIAFLFCAIFTPDFFSFSMRYLVIIICTIGIVWHWIRNRSIDLDKRFLSIFIGFIPFVLWLILAQIIHIVTDRANTDVYVYTLEHTLEVFLAAFLVGLFLIYVTRANGFGYSYFVKLVFIVAAIQFICVVLALVFPPVRIFFNSFIIRNSYSTKLAQLAQASNSGLVDRSYGLSNNLFDSFGFITAILICVTYIYGMETKNNKLRIAAYFMVLMPLVNARTGLVLAFIGLVIASLYYQTFKSVFNSLVLVAIVAVAFYFIVQNLPESMIKWLSKGIQETQSIFEGSEASGVYAKIFERDLIFPSSMILGDGAIPKLLKQPSVDNGYITCLWNFGIVGTAFLLFGYINMFRISYVSAATKMNKAITVVISIIFFLYLFKIYSIDNFGGIVLVFGFVTMMLVNSRAKKTKLEPARIMNSDNTVGDAPAEDAPAEEPYIVIEYVNENNSVEFPNEDSSDVISRYFDEFNHESGIKKRRKKD